LILAAKLRNPKKSHHGYAKIVEAVSCLTKPKKLIYTKQRGGKCKCNIRANPSPLKENT
jgi:hypothetical protein